MQHLMNQRLLLRFVSAPVELNHVLQEILFHMVGLALNELNDKGYRQKSSLLRFKINKTKVC